MFEFDNGREKMKIKIGVCRKNRYCATLNNTIFLNEQINNVIIIN